MKKTKNLKKSKSLNPVIPIAIVGTIIVVGLFFVFNGWFFLQKAYESRVARKALSSIYEDNRAALTALGLTDNQKVTSKCEKTEIADFDESQLLCVATRQNYVAVEDKKAAVEAAQDLETKLVAEGWAVTTNSGKSTLRSWIKGVASKEDSLPDIGIHVTADKYLCDIHFNVAYSNPADPAYQLSFTCNAPVLDGIDSALQ